MAKPKTRGLRKGGRNRQFFESLSGLASGLDKAIEANKYKERHDPDVAQKIKASKLGAAQAKRERRAERNKQLLNSTKPGEHQ